MKFLTQFSRILVGILFILSGLIKLNDPTGFSYKLDEYFAVFSQDFEATQDSLIISANFNEESFISQIEVFTSDNTFPLILNMGNWEAVNDSANSANLGLNVGTTNIFDTQISGDSNARAAQLKVNVSLGDKSISDFSFDLLGPDSTARSQSQERSINLSSHLKQDGFLAGVFGFLQPYSTALAIFTSWGEAIIGFALLIGWQSGFSALMLFIVWAFFTFLTWYSWIYNKVTDCGCFGDALPMNPYESFIKNIVLGVFVAFIIFGYKRIKPLFSNPFGVKLLTTLSILMIAFSLYCRHYLPVVDFLHYKEGTNLCENMTVPEGERSAPWKVTTYIYSKPNGERIEILYDSDQNSFSPNIEAGWTFVEVAGEEIKEEAYEPPIHDFKFYNAEKTNDYIDDFFSSDQKLLAVMYDLKQTNTSSLKRLKEIAKKWEADGKVFWALTASSPEEAEAFRHEHQLNFEFHFGDNTNLKSIIRSNPGLVMVKDTCLVVRSWPSTRLPKYKKIAKIADK